MITHATQLVDHSAMEGIFKIIIASPVFENVTQQIQRLGVWRVIPKKTKEGLGRLWQIGTQVQV